jgi:hypothetical protein
MIAPPVMRRGTRLEFIAGVDFGDVGGSPSGAGRQVWSDLSLFAGDRYSHAETDRERTAFSQSRPHFQAKYIGFLIMVTTLDFSKYIRGEQNELHGTAVRPWMLSRGLTDQLRETFEAPLPARLQALVTRLESRNG